VKNSAKRNMGTDLQICPKVENRITDEREYFGESFT